MSEGRIPQSFIDEVLLRTDIVDLVDARVKLKRAGKNYSACCPFHQEKSPSFTVNREKQFYYCFGCGATGNAISFLMEHDRLEFIDSLKQLASAAGMSLPETREQGGPRESHQPLFDTLEAAARHFEQQLRSAPARDRAVRYLKQRGVSGAVAKAFRLGYAPPGWDNLLQQMAKDPAQRDLLLTAGLLIRNEQRQSVYDAMRDRVIFPIRDFRGRVIAFGGRVLNDDKPKYLNSPESPVFHKGQELYGLYEARQSGKLSRLLVVEGYMDVVALAQFGIPEAVATLGTATSTAHVERLFRVVPEVVFCFDGDAAGRRAAWRALENTLPALKDGVSARFLFLPDGEDPDSLVRREGPELFRARVDADAVPLADQLFRQLSEGIALNSLEGRSKLANEALPLLALAPDSLFRTLLVQRLSELTELSVDVLERRLQAPQSSKAASHPPSPTAEPAAPAWSATDEPPDFDFAPWSASHGQGHEHDPEHEYDPGHEPAHAPYGQPQRRGTGDWRGGGRGEGRGLRPFPRQERPRRSPPPALRSLSARAILVLLHDASQAADWPPGLLDGLDDPETPLLRELIAALQAHPERSIAALLGSWHGTEHGEALGALAAEEVVAPPADPAREAEALRHRLRLRALEAEAARLHRQLQQNPDRETLQALTRVKQEQAELTRSVREDG